MASRLSSTQCGHVSMPIGIYSKKGIMPGVCIEVQALRSAQNHRVFFREHANHFKIERVLDRKEAYR